jgi:hypothetical protein
MNDERYGKNASPDSGGAGGESLDTLKSEIESFKINPERRFFSDHSRSVRIILPQRQELDHLPE